MKVCTLYALLRCTEPLPRAGAPAGDGARAPRRGPGGAGAGAGSAARGDGDAAARVRHAHGHQDLARLRDRHLPRAARGRGGQVILGRTKLIVQAFNSPSDLVILR